MHVDPKHVKYKHIYKGIDIIVRRIAAELAIVEPVFLLAKWQPTGSISSDIKVGLPHEVDFLLYLPSDSRFKMYRQLKGCTLYSLMRSIIRKRSTAIFEGLENWNIQCLSEHSHIDGVCLMMKWESNHNIYSQHVGASVDIVPVYHLESTNEVLTDRATIFLPHSLSDYAKSGHLYRLINSDTCDTGLIKKAI